MWQWVKCFFGEHNWYWLTSEFRECRCCKTRQRKIIRTQWKDLF